MSAPTLPTDPTPLDERTHEYLVAHPDVWTMFCAFAFALIRAGRSHGGAKAVVERIRWEANTSAHHADLTFVVDNRYTASLSRIFAATYPAHSDFFVRRKRPTERAA